MSKGSSSFYRSFKLSAVLVEEQPHLKVYSFEYAEQKYIVYQTKVRANCLTVIDCKENTIIFKKKPFNIYLIGEDTNVFRYIEEFIVQNPALDKKTIKLFVISGLPHKFYGLDEGIFLSARKTPDVNHISVMSEKAFKGFQSVK